MPDLPFRLLGYGGLGGVAAMSLMAGSQPGLWLLLGHTLVWPWLWSWARQRWPDLRIPQTNLSVLVHAGESLLVMVLVAVAGFAFWLSLAVGLLLLSAVTALGGLRLFVPCMLVVVAVLIVQGRAVPGMSVELTAATIASGLLVFGFQLGLAFVSFRQAQRLNGHRHRAISESSTLRHQNARLERYLPEVLRPLVSERPSWVNRPTDHFTTVAFIDIVGFTELVASKHLAELVDVVNDFISMMGALTERRGGILSKFLGDGVLIYFPEPDNGAIADRSEAAAQCARVCLDLQPGLLGLADCWLKHGLVVNLHTRAGIASGYCAIGDWGGGARLDYTLIGSPVNLASRLQAEAVTGGILVSAAAAALLREIPPLADRLSAAQERHIKGFGVCMVHELCGSAKVRANGAPDPIYADDGQDIPQSL